MQNYLFLLSCAFVTMHTLYTLCLECPSSFIFFSNFFLSISIQLKCHLLWEAFFISFKEIKILLEGLLLYFLCTPIRRLCKYLSKNCFLPWVTTYSVFRTQPKCHFFKSSHLRFDPLLCSFTDQNLPFRVFISVCNYMFMNETSWLLPFSLLDCKYQEGRHWVWHWIFSI